jgi:hypothetical protein
MNNKGNKRNYLVLFIGILFVLSLTYDIIITNILSTYYCSQEPNPKTQIVKRVEYPESIYWEDNVYPGFSKDDRALMIINYLDGMHLKTMALNGDDAKVYVYHLDNPLWDIFKKAHPTLKSTAFRKAYAEEIMKDQKVYTKETMPKLNYNVTFNEVKLNSFARKFLYADETKIIENKTKEVIAYNRRYMRFYYTLVPDFAGGRYYWQKPLCGESHLYYDGKGFNQIGYYASMKHTIGLNKFLFKKYIKGEN